MNEKIQKFIPSVIRILAMSILVGYLVFAWTEPTQNPPQGNVAPPLNTSINAQAKEGALVVGTNSALTTGLIVQYGNVGIGTTAPEPGVKLQVVEGNDGVIKIGTNAGTNAKLCLNSICFTGADLLASSGGGEGWKIKRLFVSSQRYKGDLNGLTGADSICQTLANQAGLGGTWMALMGDTGKGLRDRLPYSGPTKYVDLRGNEIFSDLGAKTFNINEIGKRLATTTNERGEEMSNWGNAWIGLTATGQRAPCTCPGWAICLRECHPGTGRGDPCVNTCCDWRSSVFSSLFPYYGISLSTNGTTLSFCNNQNRIICIER
jgi:hypothetical protein